MRDPLKQTKSDRTRATILDAAKRIFATAGYERTTIRDIAAAASIDPAMVIRYFHSKEELFARTAEFDLRLPDLRAVEPHKIGETLVRHFLSLWEGDGAYQGLAVMLRSAASNESALAKLKDVFSAQVLPALARAEGPLSPGDRAGLVASQLLGLAFCRYVIQLKPVVDLPHDLIVRELGKTLQSYLAGDG
jgi:AcrR family transcriptional regulator